MSLEHCKTLPYKDLLISRMELGATETVQWIKCKKKKNAM